MPRPEAMSVERLLSSDNPPRTFVVAAHPGDETLGAGALLARLPEAWVVHITDGGPSDELGAAMALAGVPPEHLLHIGGVAEQQAVAALPRLARELAGLFRRLRPEVVVTHAYEGGHPDHDAAALATRAAAELIRRGRRDQPPQIVEMALYHAQPGTSSAHEMVRHEFLPPTERAQILELSPEERDLKERMLGCFASQQGTIAGFLPAVREAFRPASPFDFSRPPHEGRLYYESGGFAIDSARWRDLARDAVEELEMPGWRG
jgi:N-acetylglucosamine malate deacetylase 2